MTGSGKDSCPSCRGQGWKFLTLRRSASNARRDGRARVAATAPRDLPGMRGYRPGTGGMTAVLAARPKRRVFAGSRDQVRQAREFVARTLDAVRPSPMRSC